MRVGILSFEAFHRKKFNTIGSSRIRVNNLVKHWEDAEIFKYGQKYDVVIYQKVYWLEHAKAFKGIKILDLCDPDFLHWGYKTVEMISHCDAVTCATESLALAVAQFTDKPVWVIPDRVDLGDYPIKKEHKGAMKRVGWYGYSQNFTVVNESGIIKLLSDMNKKGADLEFIVISDNLYEPPAFAKNNLKVTNYRWNLQSVDKDIQRCDVIVNPKLNFANWQFKSNNKTIHAWALGVPVASNQKELVRFVDPEERTREIKERSAELKLKYDINLSVGEYKSLIDNITLEKDVSSKDKMVNSQKADL